MLAPPLHPVPSDADTVTRAMALGAAFGAVREGVKAMPLQEGMQLLQIWERPEYAPRNCCGAKFSFGMVAQGRQLQTHVEVLVGNGEDLARALPDDAKGFVTAAHAQLPEAGQQGAVLWNRHGKVWVTSDLYCESGTPIAAVHEVVRIATNQFSTQQPK